MKWLTAFAPLAQRQIGHCAEAGGEFSRAREGPLTASGQWPVAADCQLPINRPPLSRGAFAAASQKWPAN